MHSLSRRAMLSMSGSALALCAAGISGCALDKDQNLIAAPVHVPDDFIGMHAHRWPGTQAASSRPTYGFGTARSHDHDGTAWNLVHLAPGHYRWESLDAWVEENSASSRSLIYTLYGTPSWLSTRTDQPDLYGRPGGGAAPRDLQPLHEFIVALITRYNNGSKRGIHLLETWNEPHFNGSPKDFWWGTAPELAAVGRTIYLAAKSVDPGIRILSPGFVGDLAGGLPLLSPVLGSARQSTVYQYLTASDGAGAHGRNWCDGIALHSYNAPLKGENVGEVREIARLKHMLRLLGVSVPLYNTETGFIAPHPFRSMPPAEQAQHLKRFAILQAAQGIRALCFYSHDDDFIGNPSRHSEIAQAVDDLHHKLAGATLHRVTQLPDDTLQVTTDKETFSC